MRSLADSLVVCSETQARELRLKMPSASIRAAPNAIYSIAQAGEATGPERTTDVVYVGRLVDGKKPQLLLDAFFAAMGRLPDDVRLVFVGDGPARADLTRRADRAKSRVRFAGAVWDFPSLKRIYSTAIVGVSPGPGGLSLTQSLWFGVPVLVARGEWHGPEIEAAVEGVNAVFFDADSPSALADALTSVVLERETWRVRRPIIARECAERYSVEAMVDSILETVAEVAREP
jgi:glycosyltransferase involved in cell wall biosynthesis